MKNDVLKPTPWGFLNTIEGIEADRYIYVESGWEEEDWKPPTSWFCNTAIGGRMYLRARDRAKAIQLCNDFFGVNHYAVIADKVAQIR